MKNYFLVLLLCGGFAACAGTTTVPATDPSPGSGTPAAADTPPTASTVRRISLTDAITFGNRAAPVALVVFADYECPYCARFHNGMLFDIKKRYIDEDTLLYVHKDFPLDNHPQALPAGIVARCAGAQGRYGTMQARLYEAHARLGEAVYTELASAIGLDLTAFNRCRNDGGARRAVERDLQEGERAGVTGTPTLMLGYVEADSVRVVRVGTGLPSAEVLMQEIERMRAAVLR